MLLGKGFYSTNITDTKSINKDSNLMHILPVQLTEGLCSGDGLMKDSCSVIGLRADFLEAYARKL